MNVFNKLTYLIGKINVTYLRQFLSDYLKIYIT